MSTVEPRCGCHHSRFRHVADHGRCQARMCGCIRFRAPAPDFTPQEKAVLHRIENTRPAPESWRDGDIDPDDAAYARELEERQARLEDRESGLFTGSERYGGGDPMSDYLYLKGEL